MWGSLHIDFKELISKEGRWGMKSEKSMNASNIFVTFYYLNEGD